MPAELATVTEYGSSPATMVTFLVVPASVKVTASPNENVAVPLFQLAAVSMFQAPVAPLQTRFCPSSPVMPTTPAPAVKAGVPR